MRIRSSLILDKTIMRVALFCLLVAAILLTAALSDAAQRQGRESAGRSGNESWTELEAQAKEAEIARDWSRAANFYLEAAGAARRGGLFQRSIDYATKSDETAEKGKAHGQQVRAKLQLAISYRQVRQDSKVKDLLLRSVELLKSVPSGPSKIALESRVYAELGKEFIGTKEYGRAIEYLGHAVQLQDQQLRVFERSGNRNQQVNRNMRNRMSRILDILGQAHAAAGQVEEARKAYERGIEINKAAGSTPNAIGNYINLGRLYLSQKDYERALQNLQTALGASENIKHTLGVQRASSEIGIVMRQTNRSSEAIPYFEKAITMIERNRAALDSEEFRSSYFENMIKVYGNMIGAQAEQKNFAEAFNYGERARSRSFLDVLGSKVQLARSGTLMEHERALQARISVLRAMIEEEEGEPDEAEQLRKDLDDAQKDYHDYLAKLRKENKEHASLVSVEPLTLKEVQERLDPGTTMLEYFVGNNNIYLWVVDKDRVEFVRTPIERKDLVSKVTELRDTIYQFGEKERFSRLSRELDGLLIQPALPYIRGKELVIVPHDVLHYLPFQTLQSADGRYLIERYPIYYLSSASLMQFTQEKRQAMGERVLAFGNPDLEDPKMALQFAEIEAGEIKKLYPQANVLLKKQATEEKAKTLAPQNEVIHFASHAELNEDDPLASAILLAKSDNEDGRLEVREIFGMDLKASLIVLSACETGLGKLSSGDELVGLTRAFIYAGTPSVVASLWNVEDSSTAQLMASFYKNLKTMTKVEAMRQAQLQLIRGNVNSDLLARRGIGGVGKLGESPAAKPAAGSIANSPLASVTTSHPYFWAPFILVGEGK
jgi:CHAT domain-containing protein